MFLRSLYLLSALGLGYIGGFGFAPSKVLILLLISGIGLLFLIEKISAAKTRFILGIFWGLGLFIHIGEWIISSTEVENFPWIIGFFMALFLGLCWSFFTGLFAVFARRYRECNWFFKGICTGALWTLLEWGKGNFFGGIPWLTSGYAFSDTFLSNLAPWLGVYGISFVWVTMIVWMLSWIQQPRIKGGLIAAAILCISIWLLPTQFTKETGKSLEIAIIQGNIAQKEKWLPNNLEPTLRHYLQLSKNVSTGTNLIVWPESAIPMYWHRTAKDFIEEVNALNKAKKHMIVSGVLTKQEDKFFNSAILFGESWQYNKRRLVPFTEHVPFKEFINRLLSVWGVNVFDFDSGALKQPKLIIEGIEIGVNICYELAFGQEIAKSLPSAGIILNLSNEAWFDDTAEQDQLLQMAQLRAQETGRYIVRSTNTGISAVIDPSGEVVARLPQKQNGIINKNVPQMQGITPYMFLGYQWFWVLIFVVVCGAIRKRVPEEIS